MKGLWTVGILGLAVAAAGTSAAATLPPHGPLRILIVSDEVNPHGLPPNQLTQPGDISAALTAPGTGLVLDAAPDAVREIATDDLPNATAALAVPFTDPAAYDVLIYFAHRIPNTANSAQQQADFTAAVSAFLVAGGGVISFHHGSYSSTGKDPILDLIGGTASGAVPWNTVDGQNVINVAPGHFITTNGVDYTGTVAYSDVPRGVAADSYAFFNNTPDERYPNFQINPTAGSIQMLFASDYVEGGSTHVLGFTHRRPEWAGVVVAYQPAEYQPNALDDKDGNNFQILANAIVYAGAAGDVTAVDDGTAAHALQATCHPNPFTAETTLDFSLPESGSVEVAVFDIGGRRLETLVRGTLAAGPHREVWSGLAADGSTAPPGVYFCRVASAAGSQTLRMVRAR